MGKKSGSFEVQQFGDNKSSRKGQDAVLVGAITKDQTEEAINEYLDELAFLASTAGLQIIKRFTQRQQNSHPGTFLGKGKLEEIADYNKSRNISLIIFDDELSGTQLNNIQNICNCEVLDRSDLILEIFEQRAQTSQAKIQVELAYLQYIMPRLKKMWSHLERQRGGIGTRGGAGEKELETDRRIIRGKISKLKAKLLVIEKQAFVQRKNRSDMIRVSLVGYTNAGKTTLMNKLCKSELFAEDKLFATLDTTVRKAVAKDIPYLLSDTVGFIRKLPQHLMESFHTTLEEAKEADVLLHVVDLAHPSFEEHIQIVNKTLEEIEADKTETILVFNKMDAYFEMMKRDVDPFFSKDDIENLKSTWMGKLDGKVVFISALKNENIDELKNLIFEHVKELYIRRYPYKARYYS